MAGLKIFVSSTCYDLSVIRYLNSWVNQERLIKDSDNDNNENM